MEASPEELKPPTNSQSREEEIDFDDPKSMAEALDRLGREIISGIDEFRLKQALTGLFGVLHFGFEKLTDKLTMGEIEKKHGDLCRRVNDILISDPKVMDSEKLPILSRISLDLAEALKQLP